MSGDALVACIHHPVDPDLDLVREVAGATARPLDVRALPLRESVKLRMARSSPPVAEALLATAPTPSAEVLEAWSEAEVVCSLDLPTSWIEAMPRLRLVQAYSAGLEQFPLAALAARGIRLANAAGAGAPAIAEFVFGRLVEVFRNLREIEAMQRERAFHRPGGRTLAGKTLGIVGLGAIGAAIATLARAFDMKTIATRRSARPGDTSDLVDALHGPDGLMDLLAASDVVVLCAPATAETTDLLDAAAFAAMKEGAVLCNVARGALVDEGALAAGLESGRLGAAILDVTRTEPLPKDDPLWDAPNLYLSPHSSIPPDAYDPRLLALFARNLRAYAAGEALENEVDLGSSAS
ncbi:MAG: D-2-hydroxyacid dehydrogenase [bacterium]|nr:D-2-hydroxyacid dehydrogenase [bacterium]